MQSNLNAFNNPHYVNSFNFSPLKTRVFTIFIALLINNNFNKNKQKEIKVIISELLIETTSHNEDYLTLKDLDNEENDQVYSYLKKLIPNIFQDGILNFELLKQHLGQSENIAESNVFGLYWNGKNKANINSRMPLNWKTLKPLRDQSLNFDEAQNIIIEGDNLEALKILQKAYFNQVDVIYIDPPYNTGNDFVYDDDYSQSVQDYKKINNLVDEKGLKTTTNQKTSGRFHTNWLNMIYPRLILARSLLKDDGVIFISIDDNEQARLKLICDEIFGEDNFIASIIWRKKNTGGGSDKITIEIETEYILVYAKFKDRLLINSKPIESWKYLYQDEYYQSRGKYNITDLDRVCSASSFKYQETLDYEILAPDGTWFKNHRNILKSKSYAYTLGKELFDFCNQNGFIEFKKNQQGHWKAYRKSYELVTIDRKNKKIVQRTDGNSYNNIIDQGNITTSSGKRELIKLLDDKDFSFPKPTDLIKHLVNLHRNKNALVLDFFAGSATTGQAVMKLNQEDGGNRQYILIQLDEPISSSYNSNFKTICEMARARIERSIGKYQYNDKGFKYFKVVPTNFQFWQTTTQDDNQIIEKQLDLFSQSVNKQNDYEAILYELMLKSGMRLDWNIKDKIVNDHQFWIDEQTDNLFFLKPQNLEQVLEIIKQVLKEKTNDSDTKVYVNEAYFTGQLADQNKLNLCEQIKQFNKQKSKQIKLMVV